MHDVHSATVVSLKKHVNTFALVTPSRTYYLQAEDSDQCHSWVKAFNEVRTKLREEELTPLVQTPRTPSVAGLPTSTPSPARSTIAERRNVMGKGNTFPSIVTSSPTSNNEPRPPSALGSSRPANLPHSPTSPMALSSDEDDPFTTSHPPGITRRPTASNVANSSPGPPSSALDPNHIISSGYLMKLGSKRKTWHKRWFMLTSDRLAYSKSHIDVKHTKHVPLDQVVDAIEFELTSKHGHQPPGFYSSERGGSSTATAAVGVPHSSERGGSSTMHGGLPSSYGATSAISESGASTYGGVSSSGGSRGSGGLSGTSSQARNTFKIITTKRPFLLSAPSEEEEIRWLSAVRALIARRSS
jgi:hypothetical protein